MLSILDTQICNPNAKTHRITDNHRKTCRETSECAGQPVGVAPWHSTETVWFLLISQDQSSCSVGSQHHYSTQALSSVIRLNHIIKYIWSALRSLGLKAFTA